MTIINNNKKYNHDFFFKLRSFRSQIIVKVHSFKTVFLRAVFLFVFYIFLSSLKGNKKWNKMNPVVKKITDWLAQTTTAFFLEIILQVFIHNWNRCVEVFNFNLTSFDIEYLFGVSNAFDVATNYDTTDFREELMKNDLIFLDGSNLYASEVVQDSTTSEYSDSEDAVMIGENSIFSGDTIELNENDDMTDYKILENINKEFSPYHKNISDNHLNENMNFVGNCTNNFQGHLFHGCYNLHFKDEEIFPSFDESVNLDKHIADDFCPDINKLEGETSKKCTIGKLFDEKCSLLSVNTAKNKKSEDIEVSTTYACKFDICCEVESQKAPDDKEIANELTHYEDFHKFFFVFDESMRQEKDEHGYVNRVIVKSKNEISNKDDTEKELDENLALLKNPTNLQSDSTYCEVASEKNSYHNEILNKESYADLENTNTFSDAILIEYFEDKEIKLTEDKKSNYLKMDTSKELEGNEKHKRRVNFKNEVKTYFFKPCSSVIKNFPSDEELNKKHTFVDMIKDEKNEDSLIEFRKKVRKKYRRKRKKLKKNKKKVTEWVESKEETKYLDQKLKINELEDNEIDKEQVHSKDEPLPNTVENSSLDEQSKKDIIKNINIANLDGDFEHSFRRRLRNKDCSIQDFSISDVDNIVYIGKQKQKRCPTFSLCHDFFRKKKE